MLPEALIDAFTEKLRAAPDIEAWLGTDVLGDVRIYYAETKPPAEVIFADPKAVGTEATPMRYGAWRLVDELPVEWLWGGARTERYIVETMLADESDGKGTNLEAGYQLLRAIFEPPGDAKWSDMTITDGAILWILRRSGQGPEKERDEWFGATQWEIAVRYNAPA